MNRIDKKKLTKFILILLLVFSNQIFAQQEHYVSGQVIGAKTKKGLESCAVGFYSVKDSSLVKGVATDSRGFFEAALASGKYRMEVDYMGYKKQSKNIYISRVNQFVGTTKLVLDDNMLKAVTIKGETKDFKVDKDVYVVTNKMKVGTANTKDVLAKVKGVTYDRYNNSIKVDGEDNIKILVNGLEKDKEYIKNLDPDRLKKIEVIRDPGGKYGLEGYSAIIDVILKTNYKGTEFFIENQLISDPDAWHKDYIIPINTFSTSLNYTYNKVNIYVKFDNYYNNFSIPTYSKKQYNSGVTIMEESRGADPNSFMKNLNDHMTIGADYYINPRHTISFESNFRGLFFRENTSSNKYRVSHLVGGNEVNAYDTENAEDSDSKTNYHSLFYIGKFDEKNTLNVDFTYSGYQNDYTNKHLTNAVLSRIESGVNDKTNTKLNAEFTHQLNDKSSIQLGYGNTYKKVTNSFSSGTTGIDEANKTDFTYKDLRHKLYAYYALNLSKKLSFKFGAAAEMSLPEAFGKRTRYFIYQPYADIKYSPIKMLDIKFKYRSSSIYPSISQANPNTIVIDNQTVSKGNPLLEPAVNHKLSVKFNVMRGLASIEPYYHLSNNYIGRIGRLRNDGIFEYTYDNVGKYKNYGIKGGLTIPFSKKLILQTNANFFNSSIEYQGKTNHVNDWTMSGNLIYMIPKHKITSGLIYQNNMKKIITPQGYNRWNNDFWGLMLQKPFLKDKLNVMVFYMLPVDFGVDYKQGSYIAAPTYNETNTYDITLLKNIFMLRVTYRFNKGKSIRKTKKEIEEEEEGSGKKIF